MGVIKFTAGAGVIRHPGQSERRVMTRGRPTRISDSDFRPGSKQTGARIKDPKPPPSAAVGELTQFKSGARRATASKAQGPRVACSVFTGLYN